MLTLSTLFSNKKYRPMLIAAIVIFSNIWLGAGFMLGLIVLEIYGVFFVLFFLSFIHLFGVVNVDGLRQKSEDILEALTLSALLSLFPFAAYFVFKRF